MLWGMDGLGRETAWNLNPDTPQQGEGQGGGDGLETKIIEA